MHPGLLPRYILEFEFFNEPTLWNRLQKHLIFFLSLSNYLAVKAKIYLVRFCNLLNTGFGWFGWIPHLQTAVATLVYWIKIIKRNNSSIFNTIKAWNNKTYVHCLQKVFYCLMYSVYSIILSKLCNFIDFEERLFWVKMENCKVS